MCMTQKERRELEVVVGMTQCVYCGVWFVPERGHECDMSCEECRLAA